MARCLPTRTGAWVRESLAGTTSLPSKSAVVTLSIESLIITARNQDSRPTTALPTLQLKSRPRSEPVALTRGSRRQVCPGSLILGLFSQPRDQGEEIFA